VVSVVAGGVAADDPSGAGWGCVKLDCAAIGCAAPTAGALVKKEMRNESVAAASEAGNVVKK